MQEQAQKKKKNARHFLLSLEFVCWHICVHGVALESECLCYGLMFA